MTAIACTIATWRDEQLLADAVRSAAPFVDVVIVLDGAYAVMADPPSRSPALSTNAEMLEAEAAGAIVYRTPTYWRDEISKRNVLLELARAHLPADDPNRWVLVLDADEQLVHGEGLRPWVEGPESSINRPGLLRQEPNGSVWFAPSRLFALDDTVRYHGRSYWLLRRGAITSLEHKRLDDIVAVLDVGVVHRWDQRSPARRELQELYGRHLAELDHGARA